MLKLRFGLTKLQEVDMIGEDGQDIGVTKI